MLWGSSVGLVGKYDNPIELLVGRKVGDEVEAELVKAVAPWWERCDDTDSTGKLACLIHDTRIGRHIEKSMAGPNSLRLAVWLSLQRLDRN